MPRPQRTVRGVGEIAGTGLHSGVETTLRVKPAPAGSGVVFVRTDLPGAPAMRADADHLGIRQRRTALVGPGDAEVHTVEHFLPARAVAIDNLLVEIDGLERLAWRIRPGVADLLDDLGAVEQDALRDEIVLAAPLTVPAGDHAAIVALPGGDGLTVSYTLQYDNPVLGQQHVTLRVEPDTFREQIAPARTFCPRRRSRSAPAAGPARARRTRTRSWSATRA